MQVYPEKYPKFMNSFCTLAKEEGMRAFLAGIAPRLIRKGLNAAITWALYEQLSLPMRIKEHE